MNPLLIAGLSVTKHAIWRTVSVICVLAVVGLLVLGVKRILYPIKPPPTNTQQGQRDNYNVTIAPKQTFFGCMRFNIPKPEELKK